MADYGAKIVAKLALRPGRARSLLDSAATRIWPELLISVLGATLIVVQARGNLRVVIPACLVLILLAGITSAFKNEASEDRFARLGVLTLSAILVALLSRFWADTEGFVFTRDFGESFSVFLAAHNANDFTTFLLQDMSTDPDRVGHPFLYTHQPSFIARTISLVLQSAGLGIPEHMLFNFLATSALLCLLACTLTKHLPNAMVISAVFFAVCSYAVFHENIVDLTRAPGYLALFAGLIAVWSDWSTSKKWPRPLLCMAIFMAAATDFAVYVFVLYVLMATHIWRARQIVAGDLLRYFILPGALFYLLYFATVLATVGPGFFVLDVLYSYLGRGGQILPTLKSLGWIPNMPGALEDVPKVYQEAGVVLWSRPADAFRLGTLAESLVSAWTSQVSNSVAVAMGVATLSALVLLLRRHAEWKKLLGVAALAIALYATARLPVATLLVLPAGFLFILPGIDRRQPPWRWLSASANGSRDVYNALALTTIAAMGTLATASVFPEYAMRFIIGQRRGVPAPLLEMLAFGMVVFVGHRLLSWSMASQRDGRSTLAIGLGSIAALLTVGSAWSVVTTNLDAYRASPPKPPDYAADLSAPQFSGASFVTTSFYGQVWYFTRGWAYMVPNPPRKPFAEYWELRHTRDWKDAAKYGHPSYFLCDQTRLAGYSLSLDASAPCLGKGNCSCIDVAEFMADRGFRPIITKRKYAIIDVR